MNVDPIGLQAFAPRALMLQGLAASLDGATIVCPTLSLDALKRACLAYVPLLDACDDYKRAFLRHRIASDQYNMLPAGDELLFSTWQNIVRLESARRRAEDALLGMART